MIVRTYNALFRLGFGILLAGSSWAADDVAKEISVLTSLQVTYSVTSALSKGTSIGVINITNSRTPMQRHESMIKRNHDTLRLVAEHADAVISIRSIWDADPLLPFARSENFEVIEIDAVSPLDPGLDGISLIKVPPDNSTLCFVLDADSELLDAASEHALTAASARNIASPCPSSIALQFWWSASNVIQMAQIIAADLTRLSPVDEELINANFRNFREELQGIKYEYEAKFDELDDVSVIALSNKFSYLTNDFFFNVVGYFEKNGADEWTDRDVESLKRLIAMNEVPVVISQWQPPEKIATAIEESGSKLVILTAMDPGLALDHLELDPDGLLKLFRKNLASVLAGFNVGH